MKQFTEEKLNKVEKELKNLSKVLLETWEEKQKMPDLDR